MYHDQALFKSPGGGHTPWHCDQVGTAASSLRSQQLRNAPCSRAALNLQRVEGEVGRLAELPHTGTSGMPCCPSIAACERLGRGRASAGRVDRGAFACESPSLSPQCGVPACALRSLATYACTRCGFLVPMLDPPPMHALRYVRIGCEPFPLTTPAPFRPRSPTYPEHSACNPRLQTTIQATAQRDSARRAPSCSTPLCIAGRAHRQGEVWS